MKVVLQDNLGANLEITYKASCAQDGIYEDKLTLEHNGRVITAVMSKKNIDQLASALQFLKANL